MLTGKGSLSMRMQSALSPLRESQAANSETFRGKCLITSCVFWSKVGLCKAIPGTKSQVCGCAGCLKPTPLTAGGAKGKTYLDRKPCMAYSQTPVASYLTQDQTGYATAPEPADGPQDTIIALSSGSGRSAVAVIRISGPQAGMPTQNCAWHCIEDVSVHILASADQ